MEILFLIIGIAVGFVIGYFYRQLKAQNDNEQKLIDLQQEISSEKEMRLTAEAELKALKSTQTKNEDYLKENFINLAGEALKSNNESFVQLARQTLEKYVSQANVSMTDRQNAIEQLLKPIKERLDKHEEIAKNLEINNSKIFGNLQNYLDILSKNQQQLEKETRTLSNALKSPRVRGRWGEIGLKRIVEFSGMSAYCDFEEQVHVQKNDTILRPDLVIHLPDEKNIVVDSKVPLNAYLEAIETEDEMLRKQFFENHAKAVLSHVKNLASKSYWSQFDNTVDFVVLYIEVESAFGAALMQNKDLIQEAIKNRIVFATPTTLITLLQTISYSWKQHKATENAIQIWQQSRELYDRLVIFSDYLHKIGANISTLSKTYNQSIGSWDSRVMPSVRKMTEFGVNTGDKSMKNLTDISTELRTLKK